MNQGTNLKTL